MCIRDSYQSKTTLSLNWVAVVPSSTGHLGLGFSTIVNSSSSYDIFHKSTQLSLSLSLDLLWVLMNPPSISWFDSWIGLVVLFCEFFPNLRFWVSLISLTSSPHSPRNSQFRFELFYEGFVFFFRLSEAFKAKKFKYNTNHLHQYKGTSYTLQHTSQHKCITIPYPLPC